MNKRIPTFLGILILLGGLVAGVILVNSRQGLESQAGPTESPKNVKISNRGASTLSVSWTTDIPLTGLIKYSEDPTKITTPAGDARDQVSGTSQGYTNHLVNVTGLGANKTYYFLIVSGSGTYDENGKPFQVRTAAQAVVPPEDVIFGKIIGAAGEPVNGAITFVEAEGGETLSTITRTDGTWRLNMANSRDKDGRVLTYDPQSTLLSIFVQAGTSGTATALTDTSKDTPVPDIVMGKNQSFIETGSLATSLVATESATARAGFQLVESQLSLSEQLEATGEAKILNPAINGEIIATDLPQFMGKYTAESTIKLTIDNPLNTQVVTADSDGNWTWTPPQKLLQGEHILTVEYTDANNQLRSIIRTFTVLSSSLPAFTATPSATPSVTETPTQTPTLTPTPTVITTMPPAEEELTDAGGLTTSMGLVLLGIILLVFGRVTKNRFK
ncbi:MAG: Adhesin for cattle intestine colonization [Candidatus Collierbacteria bacterium GW2011_GWB1_44_6]|uniref:Adhesin for cattle intestine colonization n=2 Tax=Candidatus Collieribacteriota TaxID=1752725 RepID=A0A0G1JNR9_9BACT|nr:MAG: Adhesin for cattle intestine colonization [Candidatus Collierbacteria bacterium GW2011_GWC2_43_12]KKT73176.1 MAG: Adhesin for cattle intestine colonization [Candidatus Collierbacteria bacterium GW2011_GWB1_44_6]